MKFSGLSRARFTTALLASLVGFTAAAHAGTADSIFGKVEPSVRDRMFFRLNYVYANVKTTSGSAYDVTGPVYRQGDLPTTTDAGRLPDTSRFIATVVVKDRSGNVISSTDSDLADKYTALGFQLEHALVLDSANCASVAAGLGTPCGMKGRSDAGVSTAAISLGYFLNEDRDWALEALVLGAPVNVSVTGDGNNGLNGKEIIKLKMLPPIATLGRYFGPANATIRPYLGLGVSYAMFFDVKATEALNDYVGGSSPGDTHIKLKNAFGYGPFLGVQSQVTDDWHVSLTIGSLRYRTEATLVTNNTMIKSGSAVLNDFGPNVSRALTVGERIATVTVGSDPVGPYAANQTVGTTTAVMCEIARTRGNDNCNFGTYVRKQQTTLDSTLFMFSVGRRF